MKKTPRLAAHGPLRTEYRARPNDESQKIADRALGYLDELRKRMQAHRKEADITTTQRASVPPLKPDDASASTSLALALTGSNAADKAGFATEAGLFQGDGIAAVVCGPGSIALAHQPDEFITLEQVEAGAAFVRRLIERLRGVRPRKKTGRRRTRRHRHRKPASGWEWARSSQGVKSGSGCQSLVDPPCAESSPLATSGR